MEKVVYILGAGFSAPLGLPVMSNFIFKSKDMYFSEPDKYDHFKEVFELINDMSFIKNYYDADLFNIEEILSVLEMRNYLIDNNQRDIFIDYITDVINYYTDEITPKDRLHSDFYDFIMGDNSKHNLYGNLITNILNLVFEKVDGNILGKVSTDRKYDYSMVSLNYDMVIENYIKFLSNTYEWENDLQIVNSINDYEKDSYKFCLCKLHGCIEKGNIVPPTWNKNSNSDVLETWKLANKLLQEANHIRILGYSLPMTDSYMTYLFKSSILDSEHLKSIDVITLDPEGTIKENYDNFIDFNCYRFKNGNVMDYFQTIKDAFKNNNSSLTGNKTFSYNVLEEAHEKFMSTDSI
ncbi:hypothetical protein [Fuchsiella alkaliacetigena]|uniref:hypothetical protein n=1 Tax=Fuchsiella alkaliacetigena TaxID=957042 RepID=UPI00200B2934|nr:hypothetical protein [Fuchsiella alkaliacetigena]MCK8824684.1 hypothetical protein [Fuchsiella alkaliacetigena]